MKKITAHVVTLGHMDIEWYEPLRTYRFWTKEALDILQDIYKEQKENMVSYTLDGQIYPLEQYLELCPEKENEIKEIAKENKLILGPFYTQFDEWIPSGEMIARNCLYGDRITSKYGRPMKVGYLPDNFGHPFQMPQILKSFDIDSLLFQRGMPYISDDFPDEFILKGIDDTEVIGINFRHGYSGTYNTEIKEDSQNFVTPYYDEYYSYDERRNMAVLTDIKESAKKMIERVKMVSASCPSGEILLISGGDHLPPTVGIEDAMKEANLMQDEIKFISSTPEKYIDAVRKTKNKMPVYKNELTGSAHQFILLGALSTRCFIKRANFESEALFEKYAEPIYALSRKYSNENWDKIMDESLKLLMMNHAHDSIHGSSVDSVHEEMMVRYNQVKQNCAGVIFAAMTDIGRNYKHHTLISYSPYTYDKAIYRFKLPEKKKILKGLKDEKGNIYVCQKLDYPPMPLGGRGKINRLRNINEDSIEYIFTADAKMASIRNFELIFDDVPENINVFAGEDYIENQFVKVERDGATVNLTDKVTGKKYYDLCLLKEEADDGDFWDTSSTWQPSKVVYSNCEKTECITECGEVRATMKIKGSMLVPEKIVAGKRSYEKVQMPFEIEISVADGIKRADVKIIIDNTARDHKISLHFAPGIKTESVVSNSIFAELERSIIQECPDVPMWQKVSKLRPFREYLAISDKGTGMALAIKGVYSYSADIDYYTKDAVVTVPLLRGVGNMTRLDFKEREGIAACSYECESSQCPGKQTFEFSFIPFENNDYLKQVNSYLYPPVLKYVITENNENNKVNTEFSWENENIVLSARTKTFDGKYEVLRFYENSGIKTNLKLDLCANEVYMSDLNENKKAPLQITDNKLELEVKPYEIITLIFK